LCCPKHGQCCCEPRQLLPRRRQDSAMSTLTAPSSLSNSMRPTPSIPYLFRGYAAHPTAWDELFNRDGDPHGHAAVVVERLGKLLAPEFAAKRASADVAFINQGITFSVYSDRRGVEKIFPFDLIPRPIPSEEWYSLEAGLVQRIKALNLF